MPKTMIRTRTALSTKTAVLLVAGAAIAAGLGYVGYQSQEKLFQAAATTQNTWDAGTYRAYPKFTKLAVSTSALLSGAEQELIKFQVEGLRVGTSTSAAISWKQASFYLNRSTSTGIRLRYFKVYKGSTPISASSVKITDSSGNDVSGATYMDTKNTILVTLATEEVLSIPSSGQAYSLRAIPTVTGPSGSYLTTSLKRSDGIPAAKGFIAKYGPLPPLLGIDTAGARDGNANYKGSFLWSDRSSVPHSYVTSTSSRDWFNDPLVLTTFSQSLTKP